MGIIATVGQADTLRQNPIRPFGIVGHSDAMQRVFQFVDRVADSDSHIVVTGETGTGKGLIARAIHRTSSRKDHPFVQINCASIPENLLESELFGHVKGAFTGATAAKPGKFEIAGGGTICLDEISDMGPDLQVKILRALEEKEFEAVGGLKTMRVRARIIALAQHDLEKKVAEGAFREDLFFRLCVIPISLPPLRKRVADIPLLLFHFLDHFNQTKHQQVEGFSDTAIALLTRYRWPGNVRELKNLVERLVVLKGQGIVQPDDLPSRFVTPTAAPVSPPRIDIPGDGINLNSALNEFERALIYQSMQKANGIKKKAAEFLQIKRTTLVEKIKRYELCG